jgi:hypothetical protein
MAGTDHLPTTFVRKLTAKLVSDERVEYLWLEADDDSIQWPPYRTLDLHLGVAEPHVESVRTGLPELFGGVDEVTDFSQQEAPLKGFAGSARLSDGTALSYRIERTSQVGKVPRKAVNVLIDRSGGLLIPALSFD